MLERDGTGRGVIVSGIGNIHPALLARESRLEAAVTIPLSEQSRHPGVSATWPEQERDNARMKETNTISRLPRSPDELRL